MKLQAHGIETDLPVGWEGRIAMRTPAPGSSAAEIADGDGSMQWEPEVSDSGEAVQPATPDTTEPVDAGEFRTFESTDDLGPAATPENEMSATELEGDDSSDDPDRVEGMDDEASTRRNGPDPADTTTVPEAPAELPPVPPAPPVAQNASGEQHLPVAHLANFPLPEDRGDFGSGAVDIMTADDVLLVLAEFGPECVNTPLFAPRDFPHDLTPNMFSGSALQRSHQGQAGCQIFFTHANRAFCLYTVLGRQSSAARVLPQANATLAATRISPR